MTAPHSDWPHGYEGRFLCEPCAAEVTPIRLGVFRCDGCRREGATRDSAFAGGPPPAFVVLVAPVRIWRVQSTLGVLRGAHPFHSQGLG